MPVDRRILFDLLGGWPRPSTVAKAKPRDFQASLDSTGVARRPFVDNDIRVEQLWIAHTRGGERATTDWIPAVMTLPSGNGPFAAVLYCHAHGARYDIGKQELLVGRPAMPCGGYAADLARLGIAALCIDLPCFGERSHDKESALTKRLLWQGDTLFGAMLRELASCLDYLQERDDIDSLRIACMGLSMGSTLAWWLAALDSRIKVVAELCCLADLETLLKDDVHDLHGIYMMVPGLLKHASTADINELIAPRPHFCAVGLEDALVPKEAFDIVDSAIKAHYAALGKPDHWQSLLSETTGHVETKEMRQSLLQFLVKYL